MLHADIDRPVWAAGPLRARCYLTDEAARAAGLHEPYYRGDSRPTLVIEQGDLQLWCEAGVSYDRAALLTPHAEAALELVGLPIPHQPQRRLGIPRGGRPDYIDIGDDGAGLRHDPAALMAGAV